MKKVKLFIFFNQLLDSKLYTGGETRGVEIFNRFNHDIKFNVSVICPKLAKSVFQTKNILTTGNILPENKLPLQNLFIVVFIYLFRAIESLRYISKIKNNYIYTNGDFFCNIIPAFICKVFYPKTKWVVIIHHINVSPYTRKSNFFISNLFSYLLQQFSFQLIKYQADLVFTDNQSVKKYLIFQNFKQPIYPVGNGINVNYIKKLLPKKTIIKNQICYFGRLSPTKGVMDLPEIFSGILMKKPNLTLNLIGIGLDDFVSKLRQKFRYYKCLDKVIFHGFLDYPEIYKIITQSKLCLFPSYEEGWGITLLEYAICQRPIIAYRLPVFTEIFDNNLTTVKIGDIARFTKKSLDILNNRCKPSLKNCYNIAIKYDWEKIYQIEKQHILNI